MCLYVCQVPLDQLEVKVDVFGVQIDCFFVHADALLVLNNVTNMSVHHLHVL